MSDITIGYVNVFVSDYERAITFYRDTLGLEVNSSDEDFGYASFNAGTITLGIAKANEAALLGRHTGVGFIVKDIHASYEQLKDRGVTFYMPPTEQPWGGILALFKDPDGNVFYLDPGHV